VGVEIPPDSTLEPSKSQTGRSRGTRRKMEDEAGKVVVVILSLMYQDDGHDGHEEATRAKNINSIVLGQHEMIAWYFSPYPEEFSHCNKLILCEFCLKYMRKPSTLQRHKVKDCYLDTDTNSKSADYAILPEMRFTGRMNYPCSKWTVKQAKFIVKICVCWRSYS
jgi:hypothetical protein